MCFIKKIKIVTGLFFSILLASNAYAAGVYDGIWQMYYGGTFIGYSSIHQNGSQIIAIPMYTNDLSWEAVLGTLNGNTVIANSVVSNVSFSHLVVFNSANSFTATQTSCTPAYNCLLPDGAVLNGTKIW